MKNGYQTLNAEGIFNFRKVFVCPSYSGKTYHIMKKLTMEVDRNSFIKTRSPDQNIDEFNSDGQIREMKEYRGGIVVSMIS